jgi:hypothetical protein
MKNIVVLLVAFLTSFAAMANDVNFDLITDITNKTIILDLKNNLGGDVTVSIIDLEGTTVFNEEFKANKKNRKYNLSNLNVGTYTLIVEDVKSVTSKKVYISNASLLVDDNANVVNKPTMIKSGDSWIVKNNSNTEIGFTISDANNILTKQKLVPGALDKKLYTTNIPSGVYYITYTINGRDYYSTITK